ncbi:MAG: phosphodiester glycosidase family protein [Lachnospiraceae bacterium]|nr:phosphodiester glycosidase family protein [Lachnospiraceae bacterium]
MGKRLLRYFLRLLIFLGITLLLVAGILYGVLYKCCQGPSAAAKTTFVTTFLETGQLKFVPKLVCSTEEINAIVDSNKMGKVEEQIDYSAIKIGEVEDPEVDPYEDPLGGGTEIHKEEIFDENGIRIEEVHGRTFLGKMLIIKDPSQVIVGTTYSGGWGEYGKNLDEIVKRYNGVAGVNGGLYQSDANKGGKPYGIVVSNGEIQYNHPSQKGLYLIGFSEDHKLIIADIDSMRNDASALKKFVQDNKIRDAVAFQEESSDANNHFVPLVVNGKGRELKGQGSGSNPRTAIGQRKDGAILLFVADGRGAGGHLGATASDLISVMLEYGAWNAANVDGGSSSSMYYNGEYEMTSVTFYYQHASWRLPDAFIVLPKN